MAMTLEAAPLKLCFEDVPESPWTFADGSGLNFVLLARVKQRLGEQFEFTALPWKRCLAYVEKGEMDGVIGAAMNEQRRQYAVFPMLPDGRERSSAGLYLDFFPVFVRSGSKVGWDGQEFTHLKGGVAVQAGFVVVEALEKMGVKLDQSGKSAEHCLRLLSAGSVDAAVLQGVNAVHLARSDARFRDAVSVLPLPFANTPMHLMIARSTWRREGARIERIWDAIEKERATPEYQKREQQALRQRSLP
jgi:polar amino acid transport system substrate-binding protein